MSAWLCSNEHILAIAYQSLYCADIQRLGSQRIEPGELKSRIEILTLANHSSLADRYNDPIPTIAIDLPRSPELTELSLMKGGDKEPTRVYLRDLLRDSAQMAKLVDCYVYQACDWRSWEGSDAENICMKARLNILSSLPGMEDAAWGTW